MAEYETTGPEIAKLVRKSARSTVYFAFSPGIDAKDSYLALSKRKTASHLHKVARREGPSQKVASGKMSLDHREVCLTCQTEIPALARKFKYFLQDNGMSFKVRVLDKNGELIDTDQEKATRDEEEDATAPGETAGATPDGAAAAPDEDGDSDVDDQISGEQAELREQYQRLAPLIGRVQDGEDPAAAKAIEQLGAVFEQLVEGEDPNRAAKALKVLKRKLVGALQDADETAPSEPDAQAAG